MNKITNLLHHLPVTLYSDTPIRCIITVNCALFFSQEISSWYVVITSPGISNRSHFTWFILCVISYNKNHAYLR